MNSDYLLILASYILMTAPAGVLIGLLTKKWRKEIEAASKDTSLDHAGKWIGVLERLLILTFIYTGQFSSIGFLIAAKSVLRFSGTSNPTHRKQSEYVLIGTLMSFVAAIWTALLVQHGIAWLN